MQFKCSKWYNADKIWTWIFKCMTFISAESRKFYENSSHIIHITVQWCFLIIINNVFALYLLQLKSHKFENPRPDSACILAKQHFAWDMYRPLQKDKPIEMEKYLGIEMFRTKLIKRLLFHFKFIYIKTTMTKWMN